VAPNLSVVPDPETPAGETEEPWEYPAREGPGEMADDGDLGAAAQGALDGEDQPIQEALVPACKVKFLGMGWDSLDDVPNLKDELTFVVKARVIELAEAVDQKDGDIRHVAKARVLSVKLGE
jgi:hypothetical protein